MALRNVNIQNDHATLPTLPTYASYTNQDYSTVYQQLSLCCTITCGVCKVRKGIIVLFLLPIAAKLAKSVQL